MRSITLISVLAALLLTPAWAQQSRRTLAGCLSGVPGNFTLGAVPSGNNYHLQGNTAGLSAHRNQLVRLTGSATAPASSQRPGAFTVENFEVLASTCTVPLPPQKEANVHDVTGKAGAHQKSVPDSDTRTAGEITPGQQTQAGISQQPGKHNDIAPTPNQPPARGKLAPPEWGQVGQSQAAGDRSAAAAERAEEEPGHTLGVNAMPSYAKPGQPRGNPSSRKQPMQQGRANAGVQGSGGTAGTAAAPPGAATLATPNPTGSTTQPAAVGSPVGPGAAGQQGSPQAATGQAVSGEAKKANAPTTTKKKPRKHRRHRKSSAQSQNAPPSGGTHKPQQ